MKKLFFLILLVCIAGFGCNTDKHLTRREVRAQRKLSKAINLDPAIAIKQYTDTTISGVDTVRHTDFVKGYVKEQKGFNCDSILHELDAIINANHNVGVDTGAIVGIYLDSLMKISVHKDKNGQLSTQVNVKPRYIHRTIPVPYSVKVSVPGKVIKQDVAYPAWHYGWFWTFVAVILVWLVAQFVKIKLP